MVFIYLQAYGIYFVYLHVEHICGVETSEKGGNFKHLCHVAKRLIITL
jgi:hypothetical protein